MDMNAQSWPPAAPARRGPEDVAQDAADQAAMGQDKRRRSAALAWGLLRTPLLLMLAFLLRHPILDAVERVFDIVWITERAIDVMSTPASRFALFALSVVLLLLAWRIPRRLPQPFAWLAAAGLAAGLLLTLVDATGASRKLALGLTVVLLLNWAPQFAALEGGFAGRVLRWVIGICPAAPEVLLAPRYLAWLRGRTEPRGPQARELWTTAFPGAVVVSLAAAVLVQGATFGPLERAMRSGPDVTVLARGDFNGLQFDSARQVLFATGHGQPRLQRYDLRAGVVTSSRETTGGAQGVAYDAAAGELLLYDTDRRSVLIFSAQNLDLKRSLPADLSPGDPWIVAGGRTVLLASEADEQVGAPFLLIDRDTGAVLDRRTEQAGNLLARPGSDLVYLSFFRRGQGVLAYDAGAGEVVASAATDERVDRMAFDAHRGELLVASPMAGRVLRYGADRLDRRHSVKTIFGVRVIAIDDRRDLMLVGSLATGRVAAVSLTDHRLLKSWYVGPWPRTIVVDPPRGQAFISANGALYRLDYAAVGGSGGGR
jgi:hypothetical protein